MIISRAAVILKSWAGAIAAPVLWFVQQQLVYWRLPDPCGSLSWATVVTGLVCLALVGIAALLSARQIRTAHVEREVGNARRLFAIGLAVIMPLVFIVPMAWQAIGGIFYSGCER
jgi:hypothetical protein